MDDKVIKASVQMIRIAPRKVRLVLDLVRGKDYKEAVYQYKHDKDFKDYVDIFPTSNI